ncbi:MAG TPA: ABC transporter ATP-binding protein [Candidatus Onthoplasma faecigallinarum]|nr:ABC transporter ATP-binding protein [Candidatus Onthoplasma faecigallinarum]
MKKKGIKELLSKLLPYVRPHKTVFFLSVIFDIIAIALNMTIPIFSGLAIDCMVGIANVNFHLLIEYLVIIIILSAFSSFFSWLGEYYMNILTYKTGESIRNALYNKINNVPIKYIDNHSHGDIMNTMSADVENVTDGFLSGFKAIVCGVFQLLVIMVIMFVMRWTLALIVIVIAPLSLVLAIMITKKSKRLYKQRVEVQGDLSGFAEEMMTNMKVIKAFNDEKNTVEKFNTYNKKMYTASEKSVFYASLANPASRLVNGILYGVIGVIGAFMVMNGTIKIGRVSSFLSYSDNFTKPFNDLTSIFADLNIAIASATRVFEMLEEENEINDSKLPNLKKCDGTVDLKDVEFSYEKSFKLIENLNLNVKQGQRVAIVGPTGCGKSTIINLLMRFYDVDSGSIKVSKKDIRKVTRKSFRSFYGMVLQESWLYNASVKDNVAYGKPDASMDEIIEACKLANAHAFIEKLPDGYNTIITERADNISAGQKQLLCIARIMLLRPPMMILDEATSNIDTRTEMKIQQALDIIMEGRTCFIVAHRLSTIENADTILVMNKGHIVEQGNHKELLAKKGFYYELFNSQFGV